MKHERKTCFPIITGELGLDPDFSAKLYSIALSQCKCKPVEYDHQLQRIYQRYTQEGIIRRAIRRNKVEDEK